MLKAEQIQKNSKNDTQNCMNKQCPRRDLNKKS